MTGNTEHAATRRRVGTWPRAKKKAVFRPSIFLKRDPKRGPPDKVISPRYFGSGVAPSNDGAERKTFNRGQNKGEQVSKRRILQRWQMRSARGFGTMYKENAKKSKTKREKHINYFRVRIVPRNGLRAKKSEQIAKEKNHEGAIRGLPLERGPFLRPARPAGACILATG